MKVTRRESTFAPVTFTIENEDELRVMLALLGSKGIDPLRNEILLGMSDDQFEEIADGLITDTDWNKLAESIGYINGY